MVSIILVSHNLGEVTKACVESIQRNVTIPYEIIVVDNHSDDETVRLLESLAGVRLIKNDQNLGFPAGSNMGLAAAKGDVIWFLNNDTIVPCGSLERMVELLDSDGEIGIVGPVTNRIDGRQQISVDYAFTPGVPLEDPGVVDRFAASVAQKYAGQTWRVIRIVGFSMLMRKSVLDKLGGFDERMGIGTFEDDSLSLKFAADGYQLLVARDAFIHHIGSASFKAAGGYPPGGEQNQFTASAAFGMTMPDETVLNDIVCEQVGENAQRILHVECGAGAYGLLSAENGIYAEALESTASKAKIAKNHYERLTLYTPGQDFVFDGQDFDTVILEKQYESTHTLSLIRSVLPALSSNARLILEIPRITAANGNVFEAYSERWDADGCHSLRGRFDVSYFVEQIESMGFSLYKYERKEVKRGFFNRNSFRRHMTDLQAHIAAEGMNIEKALPFFHRTLMVFEYRK